MRQGERHGTSASRADQRRPGLYSLFATLPEKMMNKAGEVGEAGWEAWHLCQQSRPQTIWPILLLDSLCHPTWEDDGLGWRGRWGRVRGVAPLPTEQSTRFPHLRGHEKAFSLFSELHGEFIGVMRKFPWSFVRCYFFYQQRLFYEYWIVRHFLIRTHVACLLATAALWVRVQIPDNSQKYKMGDKSKGAASTL